KYREPFFKRLEQELHEHDVSLIVAHSNPSGSTATRGDRVLLSNAKLYSEGAISIAGRRIRFGTALSIWKNADAVIVPDYGSSLDSNLAALRFFGPKR